MLRHLHNVPETSSLSTRLLITYLSLKFEHRVYKKSKFQRNFVTNLSVDEKLAQNFDLS
jgi:hypothetical protein